MRKDYDDDMEDLLLFIGYNSRPKLVVQVCTLN